MPLPPDIVQLALLIRRGQLKLEHVPESVRDTVRATVYKLTDAQCGILAQAQEKRNHHLGRSRVYQRAKS